MRRLFRNAATWLLGFWVACTFTPVIGEFFIEVARNKGLFANADGRWDYVMGIVSDWVTSSWGLYPLTALAGYVAGLWTDRWLRMRDSDVVNTDRGQSLAAMDSQISTISSEPTHDEDMVIFNIQRFEYNGHPPNTIAVVFDIYNRGRPTILNNWELSMASPSGVRLDRLTPTHLVTTYPVTRMNGVIPELIREDNSITPLQSGSARSGAVFSYTHNGRLHDEFYGSGVQVRLTARDVWGRIIEGAYVT